MQEIEKVNIQSTAGTMHHIFERISYTPWYAIAEFVDNSSQSFFSNMDNMPDVDHVTINIDYDSQNEVLTITDNAYGMNHEELIEALYAECGVGKKYGRNEFGMGMKTAAGWFGNKWSITTVQYNSGKKYTAVVDKETLENDIPVYFEETSMEEHGTVIKIEKLTKKLSSPRTIAKIKDVLSSMYRRDISSGKVDLQYRGGSFHFEEYPILKSFRGKDWKRDVDFKFEWSGKEYHVTGFVAIMNPGGYSKAGFALFRRDRVIIGGPDANYKPKEIYVQDQSQIALKLFGELNMDDFPVNQAKDGFVWDDGLEYEFLSALKNNISDYIKIADMAKKARNEEKEISPKLPDKVQEEVQKHLDTLNEEKTEEENADNLTHEVEELEPSLPEENEQTHRDDYSEFVSDIKERETIDDETIVGKTRSYTIKLNEVRTLTLEVDWSIHHNRYWVDVEQKSQDELKVIVNIDHPFFRPYSNQEDFKIVLEKFVISFIVAEVMAKMTSDQEGYIYYKAIRDKMNDYLKKMGDE